MFNLAWNTSCHTDGNHIHIHSHLTVTAMIFTTFAKTINVSGWMTGYLCVHQSSYLFCLPLCHSACCMCVSKRAHMLLVVIYYSCFNWFLFKVNFDDSKKRQETKFVKQKLKKLTQMKHIVFVAISHVCNVFSIH